MNQLRRVLLDGDPRSTIHDDAAPSMSPLKIGLTLPSFVEDPQIPIEVARAADAAALDGVFGFEHLFRLAADGSLRPALDGFTLLGSVAAETDHIGVGLLVARASLRPPEVLAHTFATLDLISGGRLVVAIGAGDSQSDAENTAFGVALDTMEERVARLDAARAATQARGLSTWIGGTAAAVRSIAALADGWNKWGGSAADLAVQAAQVRTAAGDKDFVVSWGGLCVLGATERIARDKAAELGAGPRVIVGGPNEVADRFGAYREAGADWIIVGPLDPSDPENVGLLAHEIRPLLHD